MVPSSAWPSEATPQLLFVTPGGAVGVISQVQDEELGKKLSEVERNMSIAVRPVGDISSEE